MNDLEVKVQQQPGKIICNFKEIKEALEIQMTAYTSLEITEEGQKEAKADLATLRKIRKAVDDQRKAVKNEFMTPYNEFEKEVKDILAVIDTPITMIDTKLKEFDERRIEEKQQHLDYCVAVTKARYTASLDVMNEDFFRFVMNGINTQ